MIDPQNAHVGTAPRSSLLDDVGGHVEDTHEGHGAGCHSAGRGHSVGVLTESAEGESRAPARLMDQCLMLDGVEDGVQRVFHRQHKAGRQLLEGPSRVHQRRRVREEYQGGHQFVKSVRHSLSAPCRWILSLGRCDIVGHTPEHLGRRFDDSAALILGEVTLAQDRQCVVRQSWMRKPRSCPHTGTIIASSR